MFCNAISGHIKIVYQKYHTECLPEILTGKKSLPTSVHLLHFCFLTGMEAINKVLSSDMLFSNKVS